MQSWASFATRTWVSQGKEAAPLSHPWIYPRPLKTELPACGAQGRREEHQQLRTTSVGVSIPPRQPAWPLDWKPVGNDLGLESSYTMSWVNFSVSWIEFGSVQLRAWHFLAAEPTSGAAEPEDAVIQPELQGGLKGTFPEGSLSTFFSLCGQHIIPNILKSWTCHFDYRHLPL